MNKRLHIFSGLLPFVECLLCERVESFLLLVNHGLSLRSIEQLGLELLLAFSMLGFDLSLEVSFHLL